MNDIDLIKQAKKGDLDAFSELVSRYQQNVRACLAVRMNAVHEAEDLAQETFVKAYEKLADFDEERALGPWLRGIAFNLLRNYWRKHKPDAVGGGAELEILVDQQIALSHSAESEKDMLSAMKHCVSTLEGDAAELIHMRYHEDKSISDITRMLGKNHSTVTMRLHRLREDLKRCINGRIAEGHI